MALVVTFRLPEETCAAICPGKKGDALRSGIKDLLVQGIRAGNPVTKTEVPTNIPTERFNLSVSEEDGRKVRSLANELGISPREVCQGVLMSMTGRSPSANEVIDPALNKILLALKSAGIPVSPRAEQSRFYTYLNDAIDSGVIGLCEAGTGTGKTLAMISAAKHRLESAPDKRLTIACPTIMLMEQFALQHKAMVNAGIAMPPLRVVIGRREFVSPAEVLRVAQSGKIDAEVDLDAVFKWLDAGGPSEDNHWADHPWMVSSLLKIAPDFPVAAAIVPDTVEEDDPGLLSYQNQFLVSEEDPEGEIILCTHAMLAVDVRRRMLQVGRDDDYKKIKQEIEGLFGVIKNTDDIAERKDISAKIKASKAESLFYASEISRDSGVLPPFHYLMVDEAHLLEQAFSNALSNYVSLYSFWRELDEYRKSGGKISAKSVDYVGAQIKKLMALADISSGDMIPLDRSNALSMDVSSILKEACHAASVLNSIKNSAGDAQLGRLKREMKMLCVAGEKRSHTRAYIKFSPVRAFPQIFMGAPSVDHALSFLWASCRSAACVSATLYLPRGDGFSPAYQSELLAIPKDRQREYTPVVPDWLFHTVSGVYFPEKKTKANGRLWLRPPSRSDGLSEIDKKAADKNWLEDLAGAVASIHADAAGGILVLMTSYASVEILAPLLPGDLCKALVVATPDTSLSVQRTRYLTHSRHGRKPVWLAVGGAWTGLDVGGHGTWGALFGEELPPEQDNVLTDLVIARVPFGTNKTMTHMTRLERNTAVPWEALEATFRTKQGIGRLVRRAGLPSNRRVFILDGRLNDSKLAGYLSRITALTKGYKTKIFNKN